MNKKFMNDLWWIRKPHCRYAAPLLMTLTMWWRRLCGKRVYWIAQEYPMICESGSGHSWWEMRCMFPAWAIKAECNARNWMIRKGVFEPKH